MNERVNFIHAEIWKTSSSRTILPKYIWLWLIILFILVSRSPISSYSVSCPIVTLLLLSFVFRKTKLLPSWKMLSNNEFEKTPVRQYITPSHRSTRFFFMWTNCTLWIRCFFIIFKKTCPRLFDNKSSSLLYRSW